MGKTLMTIRHAFFDEEKTGQLKKPTPADVQDCWDWRQPLGETCTLCAVSAGLSPLGYAPFYSGPGFYKQETVIWEAGTDCARQHRQGVALRKIKVPGVDQPDKEDPPSDIEPSDVDESLSDDQKPDDEEPDD